MASHNLVIDLKCNNYKIFFFNVFIRRSSKRALATKNLKINSYSSDFSGPTLLDKPEYYESLNEFDVQMKGSGTLQIDSKVYYCDIQKGICYPGKISKKESIQ